MKNILNNKFALVGLALLVGLVIGWLIKPANSPGIQETEHDHSATVANEIWTCSMHPQVRKNEAGDCPICGMDLIPLERSDSEIDPMAVSMSPTAMQLADVQTLVVGMGNSAKSIRLNGKIQADERNRYTQSAHIPGRIEKLTVSFTGEYVNKGQVIAYIYSPELVNAQEELFEAQKIKASQPALFKAAKEKLKNWKLSETQIDEILKTNKALQVFPILANVSGYVTKKAVNLGDYVKTGQPIFEIADLSKVWVLFDVYESEMESVKKGDKISYTVQSLTGKVFSGIISYVDPLVNSNTRVVQARVEVDNTSLLLKPEMFVSGIIESNATDNVDAVIVPKTAVMWTGKRSVVYVKVSSAQSVNFRMREVTLGPSLGDSYIIEEGLELGEEVAVNGTFSIDAAAQLAGKPSMMSPEGGMAITGHNHGNMNGEAPKMEAENGQKTFESDETKKVLEPLFDSYFKMKSALAADDFESAKKAGTALDKILNRIDMANFEGDSHQQWMDYSTSLKSKTGTIERIENIEDLRAGFISISKNMISIAESFRPISDTLYVQNCAMANDNNGADWLSQESKVTNPYFGEAMLSCGETTRKIK